jgi:hypothetical protein
MQYNEDIFSKAMEIKKREDGTEFHCFSDEAPEELKDLFLRYYSVRDLDYEIFSVAIDTIVEAWNNNEDSPTLIREYIEENYNDFSSVYTADMLGYLNIWNHDEILENIKEMVCDIPAACAYWYDSQVKSAINIILDDIL